MVEIVTGMTIHGDGLPDPGAPLGVRLFGPFELSVRGESRPVVSRTLQRLIALLVLRRASPVERAWLAGTLWPDAAPALALFYLRRALTNLRTLLGPERDRVCAPTATTLRLELTDCSCDVADFDALSATGTADAGPLQRLIALYRGPLLAAHEGDWVVPERERRATLFADALERLACLRIGEGDLRESARLLKDVIRANPLRETAHCRLMEVLARSGDAAEVERQFQELRRVLRDELNTAPAPDSVEAYRRARQSAAGPVFLPPSSSSAPPQSPPPLYRLPCPLTALIGRNDAVREIAETMNRHRLTTLTGPGGVGKTRLAIAAAEARMHFYVEGVVFVDLSATRSEEHVADAVAEALGLRTAAGAPVAEAICRFLHVRRMLLLLDNCEHLRDRCARIAERLLQDCPFVHLLCTSREALGVAGEAIIAVTPLGIPEESSPVTDRHRQGRWSARELVQFGSVALFCDRAAAGNPRFHITERNAGTIAQLCRRLDGLPLALELAAAHSRYLTPTQIAARLEERFRLLQSRSQPLRRHQTLEAVIASSCDALSHEERLLLNRLSVFAGAFDRTAAESVCGSKITDGEAGARNVSVHLTSLVKRSLVFSEPASGADGIQETFRLLESVRDFTAARLDESGEADRIARRHLAYYGFLCRIAPTALSGPDQAAFLARMAFAYPNIMAALERCRKAAQTSAGAATTAAARGLRIAVGLERFWSMKGRFLTEGRQIIEEFLENHPQVSRRIQFRARMTVGGLAFDHSASVQHYQQAAELARSLGDERDEMRATIGLALREGMQCHLAEARALYEAALVTARRVGDERNAAVILAGLARVAFEEGDLEQYERLTRESLAVWRTVGNRRYVALMLLDLARAARLCTDHEQALQLAQESLHLQNEIGDRGFSLGPLNELGLIHLRLGNVEQAEAIHRTVLDIAKEMGSPHELTIAHHYLAYVLQRRGDDAGAWQHAVISVRSSVESGDPRWTFIALECAACVAVHRGRAELATRLFGAAEATRQASRTGILHRRQDEYEAAQQQARSILGEDRFERLLLEGGSISHEEAVGLVLKA